MGAVQWSRERDSDPTQLNTIDQARRDEDRHASTLVDGFHTCVWGGVVVWYDSVSLMVLQLEPIESN